jgi:hypothetical protein
MTRKSSKLWAIDLASELDWHVFPIPPNRKEAWKGWPQASTNDADYIAESWPDEDANIGVHCGPSGLLVLDIDVAGSYVEAMSEITIHSVPDTLTVRTASGKWHLYFSVPLVNEYTNRVKIDGTQVDVRVNNGYVLGPGSVINDSEYEIVYDDAIASLESSPRLVKWVKSRPRKLRSKPKSIWNRDSRSNAHAQQGILQVVLDAPDGELNSRLYWASCRAGEMVKAGQWELDDAERSLTEAATKANLESYRIGPTIQSGLGRGMSDEAK